MSMPTATDTLTTSELNITDAQGRTRMQLLADADGPALRLLREDGNEGARVSLDANGLGALTLGNPDAAGPTARLEVDAKGTHVKFERPGGATAYVFLNNAGTSGLVLVDGDGKRRIAATVTADGSSRIERYDAEGNALE